MQPSILLLTTLFTCSLFCQAAPPGSAQPFQSGDTVCWVGDSITHGGSYHAIVELFYATRFPDRTIHYYNEGIGGDRASGIVSDENYRLNADILSHKATVATIMLGMNDINRGDYTDQPAPEAGQKHQHFLDLYEESMRKLMDSLTKAGARLILIQPSIYDDTTTLPAARANSPGSNAALEKCSLKIQQWANEYHAGTVNFYGEMNEVNQREQKKDPNYTLVGADRIHPGPVGHFVMAYTFLKAQNMPREVSALEINAKKEKPGTLVNSDVRNIRKLSSGLEFDATEKALPLVVSEAARPALALVPFMDELNREMLTVTGLSKGQYVLKIDEADVGEFSAAQLGAGINLAENAKTPQYQQSAAATQISADRTKAGAALRDISAQKYGLSKAKVDVSDHADVEKRMRDQIAAAQDAGKPVNRAWKAVLADLAEPGKLMQQYDGLSAALLQACQPKEHHYSLTRTP
jgi:lysophospholipase L1-like esterase